MILALNWQALRFQRARRASLSGVNYTEKPLDFPALLEEIMRVLVEDAAAEPHKPHDPDDDSDDWPRQSRSRLIW